jgi:membrane-bound serine protease (ClpP class)
LLIILIVIFLVFVVIWVIRAQRRKVEAGKEELIGRTAVVEVALAPKGIVLIEGERWTAVIDKGHAEPEDEVTITMVDGLKLTVTKKQ